MNKEPETYTELITQKKCADLTNYFKISQEDLETIYTFLLEDKQHQVYATQSGISLCKNNTTIKAINAIPKSTAFDSITITQAAFSYVPHITYTSSSGSSYSGGSSNNNNNNNNNNNR